MDLPEDIYEKIRTLCGQGDRLASERRFTEALPKYEEALKLLPSPEQKWEAATWILAAMGDAHFLASDFEAARQVLTRVMLCPNATTNPFIWLRRGQVYFELGILDLAADSLASAYALEGEGIFKDEDPKYASWILPRLRDTRQKG
jgi:tetratricopeptide (TPR) repeat protein